jgi:hypothetical protein
MKSNSAIYPQGKLSGVIPRVTGINIAQLALSYAAEPPPIG